MFIISASELYLERHLASHYFFLHTYLRGSNVNKGHMTLSAIINILQFEIHVYIHNKAVVQNSFEGLEFTS